MRHSFSVILTVFLIFVTGSALGNENRDRNLHFPVTDYNNNLYDPAIRGFEDFIDRYPDDSAISNVRRWLSFSYYKIGQDDDAYRVLKNDFEENPTPETFRYLAFFGKQLNKTESVSQLLTKSVLSNHPKLQKFKIHWMYQDKNRSRLSSILESIPKNKRSAVTMTFLRSLKKRRVKNKANKILKGKWPEETETTFKYNKISDRNVKNWIESGAEYLWENSQYQQLINFIQEVPSFWRSNKTNLYLAESLLQIHQRQSQESSSVDLLERAEKTYENLRKTEFEDEANYGLAWIKKVKGDVEKASNYFQRVQDRVDWLLPRGMPEPEKLSLDSIYRPEVSFNDISIPEYVDYRPTQDGRYFNLKGRLPIEGGKILIVNNDEILARSKINFDGSFDLGPLPNKNYDLMTLYLELSSERVVVIDEKNTYLRPVQIFLGSINPQNYFNKEFTMKKIQTGNWRQKALELFGEKLQEAKELKKKFKIEFMEELEERKIRRNGAHLLIPQNEG